MVKCLVCECIEEAHLFYWKCPLYGDIICSECCWSVPKIEEYPEMKERLIKSGVDINKIPEICKECGRNGYYEYKLENPPKKT